MHRAVTIEMHLAAWRKNKGITPRQRHVFIYDRQVKKKQKKHCSKSEISSLSKTNQDGKR